MRKIDRARARFGPRILAMATAVLAVLCTQPLTGSALAAGTCDVTNETSGQVYPTSNGATLQQAFDESSDGDRLFVSGRCFGGFTIEKNLTIFGGILDGGGTQTVLQVSYVQVTLIYMLITNGYGDPEGGGIINNGGTIDLRRSDVTDNRATQAGGGVFNQGVLILHQYSSIEGNAAAIQGGGGVYNLYGSVQLRRASDVSTNRSGNVGGGIENDGGQVLMYRNARVRNNRSRNSGGGIFSVHGPVKLHDDARVIRNVAGAGGGGGTANGGGVFNDEGSVLVLDDSAQVAHNQAKAGGGVCNSGYQRPKMLVMKADSSIKGNVAVNGGGICNYDATIALRGASHVSGNTATNDGGGIWDLRGTVSMQGSPLIDGNTAEGGTANTPAGVGGGIRSCNSKLPGVVAGTNVANNDPTDVEECP